MIYRDAIIRADAIPGNILITGIPAPPQRVDEQPGLKAGSKAD